MLFYIYLTHESLEIINVGIAILISEILLFMSSYILLLKYVIDIKFNWTMRKLFIPLTSVITTFIFSSLLAIDTLNITLIISIFVILQLFFSVLFYKKTSELTKIKILELGSHEGKGIASFYYYLPYAKLYGANINPFQMLFYSKRINEIYIDVSSKKIVEGFSQYFNLCQKNVKIHVLIN